MSKRLNKLREKRGAMADELTGIIAKLDTIGDRLETADDRDPSDAETAEIKGHKDRIAELKADLDKLDADIADEQRVEAARASAAVQVYGGTSPGQRGSVPAQARHRYGVLKAFKGQNAEEDAYTSGMFLLATLGRSAPGRLHLNAMGERAAKWLIERGIDVMTRAQNEGSNTAGGFLVIPAFEQAIIDLRESYGTFRRHAGVTPMASDTQSQPVRASGLTAYWVNEAAQVTESEKAWGQVTLTAKKLAALSRFSSELNEDAIISIADDLAREMAYAFSLTEDNAGWNGDGTSTHGGILGVRPKIISGAHTASVHTASVATFGTLTKGDLEGAMGKLPKYVTNPRWYISNPGWVNALMRIATAAGGVTATEMANGIRTPSYLGYPVETDQTLPKVLTSLTGVAMAFFGDLSLAVKMGERRGITISLSDQRYWEFDQIGIRATERVDIVAHSLGSTTDAGPLIALVGA